jgi:MFS family permease
MSMSDNVVEPPPAAEPPGTRTPRKAAFAGWIGSVVEYYDFFIYGTAAALVFSKIFFPSGNPTLASLAALATFGVGYIARPIGAAVLGHYGDRFGRQRVMMMSLVLMGTATFLVGCLPTYGQIGIVAPIALVVLRLLQGFSAGGEQSGANSMTLEHAPAGRRAFFTSFTLSGTQAGLIVATLIFIPLADLPTEALMTWGWRIPFFLSVIVVGVGIWVRRAMPETPAFAEAAETREVAKLPIATLFREHGLDVARVVGCALVAVVSTITSVYALSYATGPVGLDKATVLAVGVVANVVALGAIPLWAALADRIGRKPVFIGGALGSGALTFAYLAAISSGNYTLIFVTGIALVGVVYSAANGVWPSLYGEMFSTRVRCSGMAIGTQIGFALGGFAPTIATALAGPGAGGWVPVAVFTAVCTLIAAGCALSTRETYRVPMHELGAKPAHAPVLAAA